MLAALLGVGSASAEETAPPPPEPAGPRAAALAAARAGDFPAAERLALDAVRTEPRDEAAADLARLARARQDASGGPRPAPSAAEAERALRDGRSRDAERMAREALAAGAREVGPLARVRGRALLALGQGPAAAAALRAAAGAGHAPPELWLELGQAALLASDPAAARAHFERAEASVPSRHPVARRARERLAARPGHLEEP